MMIISAVDSSVEDFINQLISCDIFFLIYHPFKSVQVLIYPGHL